MPIGALVAKALGEVVALEHARDGVLRREAHHVRGSIRPSTPS